MVVLNYESSPKNQEKSLCWNDIKMSCKEGHWLERQILPIFGKANEQYK